MAQIIVDRTHDAWPKLSQLIGVEVASVRMPAGERALLLEFGGGEEVEIPAPWMFTSCLMSVASIELLVDSDGEDDANAAELIGLAGARLTAVESDAVNLDLVFNSIRISVSG